MKQDKVKMPMSLHASIQNVFTVCVYTSLHIQGHITNQVKLIGSTQINNIESLPSRNLDPGSKTHIQIFII